ncbi:uncharacterized protein G2W53_015004 [Senna tora]|uniref:Uncharacterized protein n=1 Tax=Senna tora TaxID=362788 RepID=A0A834WUH5_9FABA|nr:uncharacterized protein G2W53_015004 [Senna tora]
MLIPSFEIPILSHYTTVGFTKSSLLKLKGKIEEKKQLLWKKFLVELLLLILNIPQYDFNLKVLARQKPVENPKQSRARDFPHLPPNQTLPLPRRRMLLLLHSPEALLRFLWQDLLQRDNGAETSDATRQRHREICPVAMDPPSMVRVFAADESV